MDSSLPTRSNPFLIVSSTSLVRWSTRRKLLCSKALWGFLSLAYLSFGPFINAPVVAQIVPDSAQSVTINFDNLATNTIVTNQYEQVKFSGTNFSGGQGGPQGNDVWTQSNFGFGGSSPNAIFSTYNPSFTNNGYARGHGSLFLDFTVPVNNLSFSLLNVRHLNLVVWVYVNRFFYGYYSIDINGNGSPYRFSDLAGIQNITGIQINPTNWDPIYSYVPLYYDDFTFTPDFDIRMTNARVNGVLNGTTQNALVGADIALNASVIPSARSGGAYSWTFTGSPTIVSGTATSSSVTIRANDVGTLTAKVTYTLNGFTATGAVTINAVLPSLTSFTAQQGSDLVAPPGQCRSDNFWWYKMGCVLNGQIGMNFSSSVHAPTFISDPSQSGVKYVQAVSAFRKKNRVGLRCDTRRSSESDVASGWQLDTEDPYVFLPEFPVHRFSEGNDLTMLTVDNPANAVTFILPKEFIDVLYIDDRFEMYVVYFTGSNPAAPVFQRPVGKLAWNWGGLVVLDWNGQDSIHHLRYSNASPGQRTGTAASSMVTMQGNVHNNVDVPCPGGPPLTDNNIDSSRIFVKYHYIDFLGRDPAGDQTHQADPVGWNFWTSTISQCVFDLNCIHSQRIGTGRAFFYSGEFIGTDPDMANPPGSPGFNPAIYNRRFVYWCYKKYLLREPDLEGWNFWTDSLNSDGNYSHIIDAFQLSGQYRDRPFF
ncbi:MAG TPA: hypothetical protein DC047_01630 [Blastocatellia bacterium]|nr:hypothetical protein [Blastocatellia bacterium]